ncbi:hypothetical protein Strain138_001064 [Pseudogemmatithrix spongiicola]|uniref:Uncharacterized protein n=1 Tax=Pseudogemmatithrix spongiicola TaxID=3062599 RepID=A0AA49JZI0_9BACT|nr:hypothetical protein Strain138_001064 [Gemmatimonadaceae bacterium 'strain 138']WKW14708.1 hypothetical protein Strain318_001064 [Gemmatimonadaceae bacterium 'strain 318']
MRAHGWRIAGLLVALACVVGVVHVEGPLALVAAIAAVIAVAHGQVLAQALLDSLNPRTDSEAKYLRRVGRDILERQRQQAVQDAARAERRA